MLVGPLLFVIAFAYLSAILPCIKVLRARSTAAHDNGNARDAVERWSSYLLCVVLLIVPALAIPSWIPLRNDIILIGMWILSTSDAIVAHAVLTRHVAPQALQMQTIATLVKTTMVTAPPTFANAVPLHAPSPSSSSDNGESEDETERDGQNDTIVTAASIATSLAAYVASTTMDQESSDE